MKIQDGQVKIQDGVVIGKAGERDLHADLFLPPIAVSYTHLRAHETG